MASRRRLRLVALIVLALLAVVGTSGSSAPMAQGNRDADFTSFFGANYPQWQGSGWSACTPVTWSVDTRELKPRRASREIARLDWAFRQWSRASGLAFRFTGQVPVRYDQAAISMAPADGSSPVAGHVYLVFQRAGESNLMTGRTFGFGWPTGVNDKGQITGGAAAFRTEFAAGAGNDRAVASLYLHELGHVLGLGHASTKASVMYPIVTSRTTLGAGDIAGIQAMTHACSSATGFAVTSSGRP